MAWGLPYPIITIGLNYGKKACRTDWPKNYSYIIACEPTRNPFDSRYYDPPLYIVYSNGAFESYEAVLVDKISKYWEFI